MLTRLFTAIRALLYASVFVLLWSWVVAAARPLDPRLAIPMPQWLRAPGLAVAILGAGVALWCIVTFVLAGRGTPAPFDAPREFVAVGPYRYVRNPMYLGAVTVIIGAGLILRSPSALGVALVFVALAHVFVLLYEEPTLEERFGESYSAYKASVNRWLPRLKATFRTLAVAMPVLFALHVVEEAPSFVTWFNSRVTPPISPGSFLRVNAIAFVITLGVALALAVSRKPLPALAGVGWVSFLMLANGVFHLVATLVDESYCPGVVTGVLLYLPFSLLFARAALRETHLPTAAVVVAALVGAAPMAVHGYLIVFRGSRLF